MPIVGLAVGAVIAPPPQPPPPHEVITAAATVAHNTNPRLPGRIDLFSSCARTPEAQRGGNVCTVHTNRDGDRIFQVQLALPRDRHWYTRGIYDVHITRRAIENR